MQLSPFWSQQQRFTDYQKEKKHAFSAISKIIQFKAGAYATLDGQTDRSVEFKTLIELIRN